MRPAPGMRIAIDSERPEDLFAWFDHVPSGTISSVLRWQQIEAISACRATGWCSVVVRPRGRQQ